MNAEILEAIAEDIGNLHVEVFSQSFAIINGRSVPCIPNRVTETNEVVDGGRWIGYSGSLTVAVTEFDPNIKTGFFFDENGTQIMDEAGDPLIEEYTVPMPKQGQNIILDGTKRKVSSVTYRPGHPVVRLDLVNAENPL